MYLDLSDANELAQLKRRLEELSFGEAFEGVKQRDGNNFAFMKGWTRRRQVADLRPGQKVIILFNGYSEKAIAWVEAGGEALAVPLPPADVGVWEHDIAIEVSGERYDEKTVAPAGKVVVFRFKPPEW
jgi:hypothetical protein